MPTKLCELDARLKGSMQETEDWWRLMRDDNGEVFVEHEWSHTRLNSLTTDSGTQRISIAAFLKDDHPWSSRARDALARYLKEHPEAKPASP